MQLSAVLLARVLGFIDSHELNPHGTVFLPSLVPFIVERFNFQTFPTVPGDFDESNGITFKDGFIDGQVVDELALYGDGIKVDTRSTSDQAKQILIETLEWLASEHGITYTANSIKRWAHVSNLSFESEIDIDETSPAVSLLKKRVAEEMSGDVRVTGRFCVESITIGVEKLMESKQSVQVNVARRVRTSLEEGKYFSTAPMSTAAHISVLEDFEREFLKGAKK